ncbi:MAG: transposase [Thermoproteus sp.]
MFTWQDNLSDEKLEKKLIDRLTFKNFLNYPDQMPNAKTIWYFRELLSKIRKNKAIWKTISKQLEIKRVKIKNGTIQDATFIISDTGHSNYKKDKGDTMKYLDQESVTQVAKNKDGKKEDETKNKERMEEARTRRSRDGIWTKKNDKLYFGYKLHTLVDGKSSAILNYSVIAARDHDSQTDLSIPRMVY